MMRRQTRDELIVLVCFSAALSAAIYVVIRTVQDIRPADAADDAASSLWQLILLSLGGATLAFAVVEFLKRLSPLLAAFNRRAVRQWFGHIPDAERAPFESPNGTATDFHAAVSSTPAPLEPDLDAYYSTSLSQLAAQLAQSFNLVAARLIRGDHLDEATLATLQKLLPRRERSWDLPSDVDEQERADYIQFLRLEFESRLDRFLVTSTSEWRTLLQTTAALVSGVLSAVAALTAEARFSVVLGALLFGVVIGGPFAWTIRDLLNAITRRSGY
jgi:hypothetical protein